MGVPSIFQRRLAQRAVPPEGRRWLYVPYDQLTDALGPLARAEFGEAGDATLAEIRSELAARSLKKSKLTLA